MSRQSVKQEIKFKYNLRVLEELLQDNVAKLLSFGQ
jgi:hypothetical protein